MIVPSEFWGSSCSGGHSAKPMMGSLPLLMLMPRIGSESKTSSATLGASVRSRGRSSGIERR